MIEIILSISAVVVCAFFTGYIAGRPKKTVHPDTERLDYLASTHRWLMYHAISQSWGVVAGAGETLVCARADIRKAIDSAKDSLL